MASCRRMAVVTALLGAALECNRQRGVMLVQLRCLAAAARGMPLNPALPLESGGLLSDSQSVCQSVVLSDNVSDSVPCSCSTSDTA